MLGRLDAELRERLRVAFAPRSSGPLNSAVRSFAKFARRVPSRVLFRRPAFVGDLEVLAHNEWTLCLWAVALAGEISGKTRKLLKANTIAQRISLFKGLVSHRYGFQIAGDAPRLGNLLKDMRAKDPLGGSRRARRALRYRHLRKVWKRCSDVRSSSFVRVNEWAAVTTARHVLARGGELETIMRRDLTFHVMSGSQRRYAVLWIRPMKKRAGQAQPKIPQLIGECDGAGGASAYAALERLVNAPFWQGCNTATTPLFRSKPSKAITTGYFRALVRKLVKQIGLEPKMFGAQSARIGGATDLAATGKASQLLLQAKGRWSSDIGKIYARMTRKAQLAVSDMMYECSNRDLEEIMPEFVQPA